MSSKSTIRELVHDADNLMAADEPVRNARQQFELETARSLILIDETGPIGLLTRSRMREIPDSQMAMPARDFMVPVPMLHQDQSLTEARQQLDDLGFDADRIPVVNNEGRFIGVIDRDAIARDVESHQTDHGTIHVNGDTGRSFPIRSGMEVRGTNDEKLGKVDQILVERGSVASFTIEHGLLGRHHKRIGAEHITNCTDDTVYVNFGKQEFGLLSNVEDLDSDEASLSAG